MSGSLHKAIWYLRVRQGIYISRKAERYIVDELEDDLFPYGFDDGSDESVLRHVWEFVDQLNVGGINIDNSKEARILKRYKALKEEHLHLLRVLAYAESDYNEEQDDGMPF